MVEKEGSPSIAPGGSTEGNVKYLEETPQQNTHLTELQGKLKK